VVSPSLGQSQNELEKRYGVLKEDVVRYREVYALPWQSFRKFAPEFLKLIVEAPDDRRSLTAILLVVEYGSQCIDKCNYDGKSNAQLMEQALELLTGDRLNDERVGSLCLALIDGLLDEIPNGTKPTQKE
jgi:hypothetical protein